MRYWKLSYCAIVLALTGCAAQTRMELARFDGAPIDTVSRERYMTECGAKAEAARLNTPNQGPGLGGAIAKSMQADQINKASFTGCMAEKGLKVTYIPIDPPPTTQPVATASTN